MRKFQITTFTGIALAVPFIHPKTDTWNNCMIFAKGDRIPGAEG